MEHGTLSRDGREGSGLGFLADRWPDPACAWAFDGTLRWWNRAFTRLVGSGGDTGPDTGADPDGPLRLVDFVHPDDRAATSAAVARLVGDAGPARWEHRVRRADGSFCRLAWTAVTEPLEQRVLALGRDVTDLADRWDEQSRVELESLRTETARYRLQAVTDPLTGVANRLLLTDRIQQALNRAGRAPSVLAVLLLDLDRFKEINDSLGHQIGDEVLVATARRLAAIARPSDTVARLGGDEFALVVEGMSSEADVAALATRIVQAMRRPIRAGAAEIVTSASVGVTVTADAHDDPDDLLRQADIALYRAKELGRDRHELFDEELQRAAVERLAVERLVRRALSEGHLRIEYQPVIDLRTDRIVAAEALLRIDDPDRGLVSPERFLDVAADAGLLARIDEWMLTTVVSHLSRWYHRGPATATAVPVAVNVTGRELSDPGLAQRIATLLEGGGLSGRWLQVEVAEPALSGKSGWPRSTLDALRALGVSVGLDDFGTRSAFSHLQTVPIDFVKIDRAFVASLPTSRHSAALVSAVIELAHALGLQVGAVGVETVDQLMALKRLGCDRAQGYLFSRSQPPPDFAAMIGAVRTSR